MPEIILTDAESVAKNHFMKLICEGIKEPCDTEIEDACLPSWFDHEKYKRGQHFFQEHRWAILESNLVGLIVLLSDQRGLSILNMTGKSSTPDDARKRYYSTVIHTLTWYEFDLTPDSNSWKSLRKVRKMHLNASKMAEKRGLGQINQVGLALTVYGFIGLPLTCPHTLGINSINQEDIEGFVHFWAVLCYMIGVKDNFNICLLPFESVKIICQILARYYLVPNLQIETTLFKHMTNAMLSGLKKHIPFCVYEMSLYSAKMYCGVPGYSYIRELDDKPICREILTPDEINTINAYYEKYEGNAYLPFSCKIPIITVGKIDDKNELNNNINEPYLTNDEKRLHEVMALSPNDYVRIQYIHDANELDSNIDMINYYKLQFSHRFSIQTRIGIKKLYQYRIGKFMFDPIYENMIKSIRQSI